MIYEFAKKICTPILKIFFPFEVSGEENLKKIKRNFILCSNHVSNIDAVFLSVILGGKIHFLAKKELFSVNFLSMIFRKLGAIPVNRGSGSASAIIEAEKVLNRGGLIGIFIEGTRSKTGKFLKPKSGTAVIACRTGVPVVPVCITPSSNRVKIFRKTTVVFGEPIILSSEKKNSRSEIRLITEKLMDNIRKLRL